MAAARSARLAIAQVNRHMPRCHGDCFMHISEFDGLVEADMPLLELQKGQLTPEEAAIGRHCADLIPDGATLQLGIGSLPDAVLLSLKEKKDLGIHSEMFSDGVVELVFVDDNPSVYMAPVDYVNDPYIIAKNDNLISINSCVQVDLMGQVGAEAVGLTQISAVGGQVDFIRGATMSKGGDCDYCHDFNRQGRNLFQNCLLSG